MECSPSFDCRLRLPWRRVEYWNTNLSMECRRNIANLGLSRWGMESSSSSWNANFEYSWSVEHYFLEYSWSTTMESSHWNATLRLWLTWRRICEHWNVPANLPANPDWLALEHWNTNLECWNANHQTLIRLLTWPRMEHWNWNATNVQSFRNYVWNSWKLVWGVSAGADLAYTQLELRANGMFKRLSLSLTSGCAFCCVHECAVVFE